MLIRLLTYLAVTFVAILACDKQERADSAQDIDDEVSEPTETSESDTDQAIEDAAQEAKDELDGNPTTE